MNLEMFYPMNFFADLHSYGVLEQIQLCCPSDNFFNLDKSKMDSGRHLVILHLNHVSYCVITLFGVSNVRRIHL